MPKGFLVKRARGSGWKQYQSYRPVSTKESDEDRASDSGSDVDNALSQTRFGSPDSGYSQSPVSLSFKDSVLSRLKDLANGNSLPTANSNSIRADLNTLSSSRATLSPGATSMSYGGASNGNQGSPTPYGSPFYFSAFDRLVLSTPQQVPQHLSPSQTQPLDCSTRPAPSPGSVSTAASSPGAPTSPGGKKRSSSDPPSSEGKIKTPKKPKAARRIQFDDDKSSPVSGTIIRDSDSEDDGVRVVNGDIDASLNFVEVTPEARAEIEKIENKIGDYNCQLCKEHYEDAFALAQHRCSRIVHVEYRCPECDKVFNCPANLASHRRWHKPRPLTNNNNNNNKVTNRTNLLQPDTGRVKSPAADNSEVWRQTPSPASSTAEASDDGLFECETCCKKFRRHAYLRKHQAQHEEGAAGATFMCQVCGKGLKTEGLRAKHMLQHSATTMPPRTATATAINNNNENSSPNVVHTSHTSTTSLPPSLGSAPPQQHSPLMVPSLTPKDWSGVQYASKACMDKHERSHSPSELFPCKYCTSIFYSSPGLTRHINKCHPTENRQVILLQVPLNRPC